MLALNETLVLKGWLSTEGHEDQSSFPSLHLRQLTDTQLQWPLMPLASLGNLHPHAAHPHVYIIGNSKKSEKKLNSTQTPLCMGRVKGEEEFERSPYLPCELQHPPWWSSTKSVQSFASM